MSTVAFTYEDTTGSYSQDLFDSSVELYKIADGTDYWTYSAGLQLNATFFVAQQYSDDDTKVSYHLKSHICNLTGGVVEYTVHLAGTVVSLTDRSEDKFLRPVYDSPYMVSISETKPCGTGTFNRQAIMVCIA